MRVANMRVCATGWPFAYPVIEMGDIIEFGLIQRKCIDRPEDFKTCQLVFYIGHFFVSMAQKGR